MHWDLKKIDMRIFLFFHLLLTPMWCRGGRENYYVPRRPPPPWRFDGSSLSGAPKMFDRFLSETARVVAGSSLPKMFDFIWVCLNCPAIVPAFGAVSWASVPKILFPVLRFCLIEDQKKKKNRSVFLLRWCRIYGILFCTEYIRFHMLFLIRCRLFEFRCTKNVITMATWWCVNTEK